jgi:hypothetical protein
MVCFQTITVRSTFSLPHFTLLIYFTALSHHVDATRTFSTRVAKYMLNLVHLSTAVDLERGYLSLERDVDLQLYDPWMWRVPCE